MEVTCPSCNSTNPTGSRFCNRCGAALPQTSPPGLTTTSTQPPDLPPGYTSGPVDPTGVDWTGQSPVHTTSSGKPTLSPEMGGRTAGMGGASVYPQPTPGGFQPRYAASGNKVIGEVRDFSNRSEGTGQQARTIWTFRVDRYDARGNRLAPVQVEMKGMEFSGSLSEGDWVEVNDRWRPGSILRPGKVHDLTTTAWIAGFVPFGAKLTATCGTIISVIVLLAIAALIIFLFMSANH